MRHSVIMRVGENLVYQCSPHDKPILEQSASPVEYNRALPEWEHTAKSYLVKKEDMGAFKEFMEKDGIAVGVPISHEDIEIYDDGFKKFARYKQGEGNAEAVAKTETRKPVQQKAEQQVVEQPKKEHRFGFKVEIDDDNGEPMIVIKNDANPESMDFKLLKSFIVKGLKGGVILQNGADGEFKLMLGNKNN